jgi:L-lactate dehydrogenase complex protein LldE
MPERPVALFVPCYVDLFAPEVAEASWRLLERAGCRVRYDARQTCCGQPFANTGATEAARALARRHHEVFAADETVVCPSASCVATVRHRHAALDASGERARPRTFELAEFLVRELGVTKLGARFPHRVALLQSCHGLRELGLGTPSESMAPGDDPVAALLAGVEGIELVTPERPDECCGFGGAFSVKLPEISARMGRARLAALAATGAEYVVGTDVSCLIHLEGLRRRAGRGPRAMHLAALLAGAPTA